MTERTIGSFHTYFPINDTETTMSVLWRLPCKVIQGILAYPLSNVHTCNVYVALNEERTQVS